MNDAVLFPGQGAQFEGMGRDWCEQSERGGARFVVELPLMAADPGDEHASSAIEGARRLA